MVFVAYAFLMRKLGFTVKFSTFPPNLVRIGPIVKTWQQTFENQDGGGRHLGFCCICIFDPTIAFEVKFSTFPPNLVKISPIVKKWQQFF